VLTLTGVDLNCYKAPQVQRRLRTYLLRSGYPNWPSLFRSIQDDESELNKLKDYLTINVTSFFRDTDKFDYLADTILPELLSSSRKLRIWSAGCSNGHEPYTLAIMLSEASGIYNRHSILATDIDRSALAKAEAGGPYTTEEISKVPSELLSRYFKADGDIYYTNEILRRSITFRYHNLLADPFEQNLDLIVCRNVVIYFQADAKRRLYQRFAGSLRPGGILFVGGTEVVPKALDLGLEMAGISFYRRQAGH